MSAPSDYSGRFAPSPTGPLHAGSLVAALASYLDARTSGGRWSVRIDDIDPPRAVAGATEAILSCLHHHHLYPDGPVLFQSQRTEAYAAALAQLAAQQLTFYCRCTRATLAPGGYCTADCSSRVVAPEASSLRIKVPTDYRDEFNDLIQGPQSEQLCHHSPNFVLRRRDGLFAYQLACAVDDGAPDVTHVIRGADLMASTHRQRFLQRCLGLSSPQYGHVAVVTDDQQNKLSKQQGASALASEQAYDNLRTALAHLKQPCPNTDGDIDALLHQAIANWHRPG